MYSVPRSQKVHSVSLKGFLSQEDKPEGHEMETEKKH